MKAGWKVRPLEDAAHIVNGGTPKSGVAEYWGGEVQWLTPKDMGQMEGREIANTPRAITEKGLRDSSARLVPPHSVILSTRAPIGHLAINTTPMAFNQGCRGIVPRDGLDHLFLYYFLLANRELLDSLGTGTTFKELSGGSLKAVPIPLPPLEEQQQIVAVLDVAFEGLARARDHTEANLRDARELFGSFLSGLMTSKSEDWATFSFGDRNVLKIVDGDRGANYPKKSDFLSEGHCLFLNTKNVRPDGFDFSETMFISDERDRMLRTGKLQARDVLLTTRGTIGNIAFFDESVPFEHIRINSGMLILRPNEKLVRAEFLFELLRSNVIKEQISQHVSGAAQPQLPIRSLVQFELPAPKSTDEQLNIVEKLKLLSDVTTKLVETFTQKICDLDVLRQSLLQKAFTGELT